MQNGDQTMQGANQIEKTSDYPGLSKSSWPARIQLVLELAATIGLIGIGSYLLKRALVDGTMRYFMVLEVGTVILFTALLAYKHFVHLTRESARNNNAAIATKKFQAEIYAGIALAAFFLVWTRSGIEMDRSNVDARVTHFEKARTLIVAKLSQNRCAREKTGPSVCQPALESLDAIFWALVNPQRNENQVRTAIESTEVKLGTVKMVFPDIDLAEAGHELNSALVDDKEFLAPGLYIQSILMIAAAMAISRKISISAFELATRQTPQGMKVSFLRTLWRTGASNMLQFFALSRLHTSQSHNTNNMFKQQGNTTVGYKNHNKL